MATVHLKHRPFVTYTLFCGGKLGMVACLICSPFCVVDGGYRALETDSILEIEG